METIILIVGITVLWFFFGYIASYSLLGDIDYYWPVYNFGPFNHLDECQWKETHYEENLKANYRFQFFCVVGGFLSIIFCLTFWVFYYIRKLVNHIAYIFN